MSYILKAKSRPHEVFDVNNEGHRRYFADFLENNTWADCPVQLVIDDSPGDLVPVIQRKLSEYYVKQEFSTGRKKR